MKSEFLNWYGGIMLKKVLDRVKGNRQTGIVSTDIPKINLQNPGDFEKVKICNRCGGPNCTIRRIGRHVVTVQCINNAKLKPVVK